MTEGPVAGSGGRRSTVVCVAGDRAALAPRSAAADSAAGESADRASVRRSTRALRRCATRRTAFGSPYATPVRRFSLGGEFVIPLPYSSEVEWLQNLQVAGGGRFQWKGRTFEIGPPEVIDRAGRLPGVSCLPARLGVRLLGVQQFLRLPARGRLTAKGASSSVGRCAHVRRRRVSDAPPSGCCVVGSGGLADEADEHLGVGVVAVDLLDWLEWPFAFTLDPLACQSHSGAGNRTRSDRCHLSRACSASGMPASRSCRVEALTGHRDLAAGVAAVVVDAVDDVHLAVVGGRLTKAPQLPW